MNDVCDAIQNKLVKLHLTGIPVEEDPEVKAHLTTCSTCRIYHDYLNHDHRELEAYAKSLDTYVGHVKQRLHRRIERAKPGNPNRTGVPWWALAAAIPLIAALVFLLKGHAHQGPTTAESPARKRPPATAQAVAMARQLADQHLEDRDTTALRKLLNSDHDEIRRVAAQYLAQIKDSSQTAKVVTIEPEPKLEPMRVAVTPPIGRHIYPDANGLRWDVVVTHEETGQPLAGVEVLFKRNLGFGDDANTVSGLTDANGVCIIGQETRALPGASIKIAKPGFVRMTAKFKDLKHQDSPYRIEAALEPGSVIGGTVRDPNGLPLAGVQVRCDSGYPSSAGQGVFADLDGESQTDRQGRWSADSIPEQPERLELHFSHPDYADTGLAVVDPCLPQPNSRALTTLRELTHEVTLSPGLSVWGQVTEANGSPVPGAEVRSNRHEKHVYTDVNGEYRMDHLPPDMTSISLIVNAENYPPTPRHRELGDRERAIDIVLRKGQSVTGQFILPGSAKQEGILVAGHVIGLNTAKDHVNMSPIPGAIEPQVFQKISCSETGRFQANHLEPGHYALIGALLENPSLDRETHTCRLWHEFVIHKLSEAAQPPPLDLGNVELMPGDLLVGEEAPDFNLLDLEGHVRRLADMAEKLVLLSFYRSDDLQRLSPRLLALNDIHERFGAVEPFVMMGMLASEYAPPRDHELVRAAGFTWPHLAVGRNQLNRTHIEYDVLNTPWPWHILISPDGIILAIGLQGDELLEAIEIHLP